MQSSLLPLQSGINKRKKSCEQSNGLEENVTYKVMDFERTIFFLVNEETLSHTSACSLEYRYGIKKN